MGHQAMRLNEINEEKVYTDQNKKKIQELINLNISGSKAKTF